eukprot:358346-Chlamydomonas_euryale.AAC.8
MCELQEELRSAHTRLLEREEELRGERVEAAGFHDAAARELDELARQLRAERAMRRACEKVCAMRKQIKGAGEGKGGGRGAGTGMERRYGGRAGLRVRVGPHLSFRLAAWQAQRSVGAHVHFRLAT